MPRLFKPVLFALWVAAAVVVLFGAAGMALGVAWVPGGTGIDADADELPAQFEPANHASRRCPQCGSIESMRAIPPNVAEPHASQIYEYTLRMADGSSSVFQETLPASWRLGERMMVIGGTAGSQKN
jgi:hypothetical protein